MARLSRRSMLIYSGGVLAAGLGGQTTRCYSAEIKSVTHRIDEEFPYDEQLIVAVDVKLPIVPALQASVKTCDGTVTRTKTLNPGTSTYTFGPFGHHCVDDYNVSLDGCLSA